MASSFGNENIVKLEQLSDDQKPNLGKTIHVTWDSKSGSLSYTLLPPDSPDFGSWDIPNISETQLGRYADRLAAAIAETVSIGNPSDQLWTDVHLNFSSIGKTLFEEILPPKVAEKMRIWPEKTVIAMATNEHWIP